jgi:hypothetical protein
LRDGQDGSSLLRSLVCREELTDAHATQKGDRPFEWERSPLKNRTAVNISPKLVINIAKLPWHPGKLSALSMKLHKFMERRSSESYGGHCLAKRLTFMDDLAIAPLKFMFQGTLF